VIADDIGGGACETLAAADPAAPLLITCEHASAELPEPWRWSAEDRWLVDSHWGSDLGAAELARELGQELGAAAVLARFSRLLIDPNRPLDSPTLFRTHAEGHAIGLNRCIEPDEAETRQDYWRAYHTEVGRALRRGSAPVVFAIHSYTADYQGEHRDYELGVLFDREAELAEALQRTLAPLGQVRLNEPYSGKAGLIYSAQRHADETGKRAIEIEVRQDCATDPGFRRRLVELVARGDWI